MNILSMFKLAKDPFSLVPLPYRILALSAMFAAGLGWMHVHDLRSFHNQLAAAALKVQKQETGLIVKLNHTQLKREVVYRDRIQQLSKAKGAAAWNAEPVPASTIGILCHGTCSDKARPVPDGAMQEGDNSDH